jgi:hypothetical protein
MTSTLVVDKPVMSMTRSTPTPLSSVAPRWILANVLPQALLVMAAWLYLSVNGITFAQLITKNGLEKLAHAGWVLIAVAVLYLAMIVWMRGAVLRPLVPRFSILGWLPAALLSGAAMLLAAAGGGLVGIGMAKALAMAGTQAPASPAGVALVPFIFGQLIGAELVGLILGGLPGLIFGAGEALAACRGTRRLAAWILWSAAAWSTVATVVTLHLLLIVFYPGLSPRVMAALAGATPILIGVAAALLTLPVLAKLARQRNDAA